MGDAFVSVLVKEVMGQLTSVAVKEFRLVHGLKNDVLALKNDFEQVQAVLQDAEEKRVKNKSVDLWLKRLRSASLEVENVLDEVSNEAMLQSLYKRMGITHRVRALFSSSRNQFMFRFRTAHKVKALRSKLDAIKSETLGLKLSSSGVVLSDEDDAGVEGEMPDRETSSLIHSSLIFGRNEETEMVVENICNKDLGRHGDDDAIRVFGIWGMGGLGKTTLAQLIYNHERVTRYFELKCWVHVSEKFRVKEIIKGIIESIDKCKCSITQLDVLQELLQDKLTGKMFLIVLDDVWIEEDEKAKWDKLSETLSCGAEGSIAVMTTRSQATSRIMAKVPELQHTLGCLSEDDSWLFFEKLVFTQGREGDDKSQLEPIGKEIVKKCKGLPLAVKTLGTLMWSKTSANEWERVKESNLWELQENNILPALMLSYDNLRPYLQRCFAYCCLYPKGYDMEKEELIQLWVSNGFISPRGETSLYLLGEEILNSLVWRSFFQVVKDPKYTDDINRYNMHDLMHDMARHVMKDDVLVVEPSKEVIIQDEALHLTSTNLDFLFSPTNAGKLTSLRSTFVFGEKFAETNEDQLDIRQIASELNLRVLYMCDSRLRTLSAEIGKLKHLKYLNLSHSSIRVLPNSIVYLQNLQVLVLYACVGLSKLPAGLRYMTNLQCLNLTYYFSLKYLPKGIKKLTNLRILPMFPVGYTKGSKLSELSDQNNLEGVLDLWGLEFVRGLSEARSANLKAKRNLSTLKLTWMRNDDLFILENEQTLEGLEPNPCLKKLEIFGYIGKTISPSWMVSLRNLVETEIRHCKRCEHVRHVGMLPNLRVIKFWEMPSLMSFHDDDTGNANKFSCLQELHIGMCPRLVSLPGNLQKLKVLKLRECERLVSLPEGIQSFKDMNELEIDNCEHLSKTCEKDIGVDWPKIAHIPSISISSSSSPPGFEDTDLDSE